MIAWLMGKYFSNLFEDLKTQEVKSKIEEKID
jgi:hypothetical protein